MPALSPTGALVASALSVCFCVLSAPFVPSFDPLSTLFPAIRYPKHTRTCKRTVAGQTPFFNLPRLPGGVSVSRTMTRPCVQRLATAPRQWRTTPGLGAPSRGRSSATLRGHRGGLRDRFTRGEFQPDAGQGPLALAQELLARCTHVCAAYLLQLDAHVLQAQVITGVRR